MSAGVQLKVKDLSSAPPFDMPESWVQSGALTCYLSLVVQRERGISSTATVPASMKSQIEQMIIKIKIYVFGIYKMPGENRNKVTFYSKFNPEI